MAGHREHVNGSSGGHGFTAHIRDVYFSRYLDRPSLTIITPLFAIPRKKGKGSYDFPHKWTLLTRLRKPIASQCIPNVRLLVLVI